MPDRDCPTQPWTPARVQAGRETKFFVEGERGLLPLLQRNDGGEGWGEEAVFIGKPLSFTLSPFVPHGERESTLGKSKCVVIVCSREKPMKTSSKNFVSHPLKRRRLVAFKHLRP